MSGITAGGTLVCSSPARAASIVIVSIDDVTVPEAIGQAVFTVRLSEPHSSAVTVEVSTVNVTASGGGDYVVVPPTILTFVPGQTSKPVSVQIIDDARMCPESCRKAFWRHAPADWLTTLSRYAA